MGANIGGPNRREFFRLALLGGTGLITSRCVKYGEIAQRVVDANRPLWDRLGSAERSLATCEAQRKALDARVATFVPPPTPEPCVIPTASLKLSPERTIVKPARARVYWRSATVKFTVESPLDKAHQLMLKPPLSSDPLADFTVKIGSGETIKAKIVDIVLTNKGTIKFNLEALVDKTTVSGKYPLKITLNTGKGAIDVLNKEGAFEVLSRYGTKKIVQKRPAPPKKNECPPSSGSYPRDEMVRASLGCPPWRN